ncbi:unnamed protein product [Spirodela intermedia]|uniref:Uncharacterized protein n=1 Tax=Spirodela intermedia TaxID=51605 RepID=A0A7I8IJM5_SPIIN|nr:unnamed protein product [Spirodela intermedia]CAA6658089.1 unnamed protein product [Spirodela intermedia]
MDRQIISNGCHPVEQKNGDFRSIKWVVELSLAAVTWRSEKMATLRLSSGCHPTKRSWMEVGVCQEASSSSPHNKRRLFIFISLLLLIWTHIYINLCILKELLQLYKKASCPANSSVEVI